MRGPAGRWGWASRESNENDGREAVAYATLVWGGFTRLGCSIDSHTSFTGHLRSPWAALPSGSSSVLRDCCSADQWMAVNLHGGVRRMPAKLEWAGPTERILGPVAGVRACLQDGKDEAL
jgi:hypothetical protein